LIHRINSCKLLSRRCIFLASNTAILRTFLKDLTSSLKKLCCLCSFRELAHIRNYKLKNLRCSWDRIVPDSTHNISKLDENLADNLGGFNAAGTEGFVDTSGSESVLEGRLVTRQLAPAGSITVIGSGATGNNSGLVLRSARSNRGIKHGTNDGEVMLTMACHYSYLYHTPQHH
jgi:hypothetical protein